MKRIGHVLVAVLVLGLVSTTLVAAQEEGSSSTIKGKQALAQAAKVTLAAALETALKAQPGAALAGELAAVEKAPLFIFTILAMGAGQEVKKVKVDALKNSLLEEDEDAEENEEDEKAEKAEAGEEGEDAEPSIAELRAMVQAAKITMAQALAAALKAQPGIALAAELENEGHKLIFTFDILPNATSAVLKEIHIDPSTGGLLKIEEEK